MRIPQYQHFITYMEGGTAVVQISRPEVRNAMDDGCWRDLRDVVDWCDRALEVRAVIITGAGERAFISGADLRSVRAKSYEEAAHGYAGEAVGRVESCTKPVIAAVNGLALGGGFELALACDLRILALGARFGFPETGLGLMPGLGGTQRLPRMIGIGRAKEVILTGRLLTAEEAVDLGLALKAVAPEELRGAAMELAETLGRKSPAALNYAKKALNASLYSDPATGAVLESMAFDALLRLEDTAEGIDAFLEKRTPVFRGK